MRSLSLLSGLLLIYFTYGFYLNQYKLSVVPDAVNQVFSSEKYYDYKGAINIYTDVSFGSGGINFINLSAKESDLDFFIVSDHNMLEPWLYADSYRNGVVQIVAPKFSYEESRIIQYNFGKNQMPQLGEVQLAITDSLSQIDSSIHDDWLLLNHPIRENYDLRSLKMASGLDAIEIINLKRQLISSWQNSPLSTIWSFFIYPFNPMLAYTRIFSEPLAEWAVFDEITQQRRLVGVAGAEATAKAIPFTGTLIKFPSYRRLFQITSNHILSKSELTGDLISDRQKIISALKAGSTYFAIDLLGSTKGFFAEVMQGEKSFPIGSDLQLKKNTTIFFQLPAEPNCFYETRLIRNGISVNISNEVSDHFKIESPGTYRIQVRVAKPLPLPDANKWLTWIYTNPFYIK